MKLKAELKKLEVGQSLQTKDFPIGSCRVTASNLRPLKFKVEKGNKFITITRV